MISWINGTIIQKGDNSLFIASQDLGFEILFGKEFLETCKIGQKGSFFVFSVCREKSLMDLLLLKNYPEVLLADLFLV